MENVYIIDKNAGMELWGEYEETDKDLRPLKGRLKNHLTMFTRVCNLSINFRAPLGTVLADFISIDENRLLNLASKMPSIEDFSRNEDNFFPYQNYSHGYSEVLPSITEIPVMNTHSVREPLHASDLLELANMVVLFRKYVELWKTYQQLFSTKWLNAFFDVLDVNDQLPTICLIDNLPYPINDRNIWEVDEPGIFPGESPPTSEPVSEPVWIDLYSTDVQTNANNLLEALMNQDAENSVDPNWVPVWKYSSVPGCFYRTIESMIETSVTINKCKNCGKYFVPAKRSDTAYCARSSPQDVAKTCKEFGARDAWARTLRESEAAGLYRKIYMSKQMLARRNPGIPEYAESFEKYKVQSKQWKSDVKAGTKTEEEFIAWLKEVKEKKVL